MKRIFSILLTLTILAGLTAIPAFASTDAETVYYFNDFKSDEYPLLGVGTNFAGELDTENGVFKISNGTYRVNNGANVTLGKHGYISVPYKSQEEKPDLCLELKVKVNNVSVSDGNGKTDTFVYALTNNSIDTVQFAGQRINAYYDTDTSKKPLLTSDNFNGQEIYVKILYSASSAKRTIYINNSCYGTFTNKNDTTRLWSNDSSGKFYLAFSKTKELSSDNDDFEIDSIKLTKLNETMIEVPLVTVSEDISLQTGLTDHLWIPEGEKANLNLYVADGKSCSVKIGKETYIDSFYNDFTYKTPALSKNDTITILANDVETNFAAYTKPYVFQYTNADGYKAVVILGRMVEVEGYTSNSYGIFYSMVDPDVTPTTEGVHPARLKANDKSVVDGNFAIELFHPDLKTGDKIYYKSYAYYQNVTDSTDKPQAFGEVNTIVIE